MSTFEILLVIYGAILAAAALGVVYRMVVGPTILDRAISSDSLVTLVVMGMALYAAHSQAAWAGPALLGLTGLAFIGTVTFARFVAREDPLQGRRNRHASEPSTDTGPHEAIHADPSSSEAWDEAPGDAPDLTPDDTSESTPDNTFLPAAARDPSTGEDPLMAEEEPLGDPQQAEAFEVGEEYGFGAQPGSRGFEDERHRAQDHGTTEEPR